MPIQENTTTSPGSRKWRIYSGITHPGAHRWSTYRCLQESPPHHGLPVADTKSGANWDAAEWE